MKDPITVANAIFSNLHTIKSRGIDSRENFVFTICQFTSGFTYNVFPDEAFMQGTIRSYDAKTLETICHKITLICENTAKAFDCKVEVICDHVYPSTVNHPEQTRHVVRLAK